MKEKYFEAINRTLKSQKVPSNTRLMEFTVTNQLETLVSLWWVDCDGKHFYINKNINSTSTFQINLVPNQYYILKTLGDVFLGVIKTPEKSERIILSPEIVTGPNEMGELIPVPNEATPIPSNSPKICVGVGVTLGKGADGKLKQNHIVRSQNWSLMTSSISLPPKSMNEVTLTTSSGKKSTSSKMETLTQSISASASMSYGAFSASVSASTSKSTATFNQMELSEFTQTETKTTIVNDSTTPLMYLNWQISDSTVVYDGDSFIPLASLESYITPAIIKTVAAPKIKSAANKKVVLKSKKSSNEAELRRSLLLQMNK